MLEPGLTGRLDGGVESAAEGPYCTCKVRAFLVGVAAEEEAAIRQRVAGAPDSTTPQVDTSIVVDHNPVGGRKE